MHITTDNKIVKLLITDKIQDKIDYLCKKIPDVEWSGVLVLEIKKGTIEKPQELELSTKDLLLADIGTTTETIFKYTDEILTYMVEKNVIEKGLILASIHSHHNMDAFFSGTDMKDLKINSGNHNFYTSVIVNNNGKIVAKIARRVTCETKFTGLLDNYGVELPPLIEKEERILINEVKIVKKKFALNIEKSFIDKVEEMIVLKRGPHRESINPFRRLVNRPTIADNTGQLEIGKLFE